MSLNNGFSFLKPIKKEKQNFFLLREITLLVTKGALKHFVPGSSF